MSVVEPQRVETETATIELTDDGILHVCHREGIVFDEPTAAKELEIHFRMVGDRRLPTLVDIRGVRSVTRGARTRVASPEMGRVVTRLALVVSSKVSMMIGNFFMRVTSPVYPTRMFTDVAAARAWLLADEAHATTSPLESTDR